MQSFVLVLILCLSWVENRFVYLYSLFQKCMHQLNISLYYYFSENGKIWKYFAKCYFLLRNPSCNFNVLCIKPARILQNKWKQDVWHSVVEGLVFLHKPTVKTSFSMCFLMNVTVNSKSVWWFYVLGSGTQLF